MNASTAAQRLMAAAGGLLLAVAWIGWCGPALADLMGFIASDRDTLRLAVTIVGLLTALLLAYRYVSFERATITPVRPTVAQHEAGHALLVAVMGGEVHEVDADNGNGGHCSWGLDSRYFTSCEAAWINLVSSLGGLVAAPHDPIVAFGSGEDMRRALAAAATVVAVGRRPAEYDGPLTVDGLVVAGRERARELLDQHAEQHASLVEVLLDERIVDGERAHQLLGIEQPDWPDDEVTSTTTQCVVPHASTSIASTYSPC